MWVSVSSVWAIALLVCYSGRALSSFASLRWHSCLIPAVEKQDSAFFSFFFLLLLLLFTVQLSSFYNSGWISHLHLCCASCGKHIPATNWHSFGCWFCLFATCIVLSLQLNMQESQCRTRPWRVTSSLYPKCIANSFVLISLMSQYELEQAWVESEETVISIFGFLDYQQWSWCWKGLWASNLVSSCLFNHM